MTSSEHERLLSTATTAVQAEEGADIDAESLKSFGAPAVTPLPKRQMFVLCWMRFSEPISYNLVSARDEPYLVVAETLAI